MELIQELREFASGREATALGGVLLKAAAALEAAREDSERLDFMLTRGARIGRFADQYQVETTGRILGDWCASPRAAIDSARKEASHER